MSNYVSKPKIILIVKNENALIIIDFSSSHQKITKFHKFVIFQIIEYYDHSKKNLELLGELCSDLDINY